MLPNVSAATVRLFVPKFDRVVDINQVDEALYRTEYGAISEYEHLNPPAPVVPKGRPFPTKEEREAAKLAAAAEAEKLAAEKLATPAT